MTIQEQFKAALDAMVEQIRGDRSILATVLCGSLSYDLVWAKSDIDLVLVTIDDRKVECSSQALYADGVNAHAFLLPRVQFRKIVEGSLRNSFMHSLLSRGKLLYSHDPSITDLFARLDSIGNRDTQLQLLNAGTSALTAIYKAHKWFITRRDLEYTSLWMLYAATSLAQIEVFSARLLADREVIPQAMKLNPDFFKLIYYDLLNSKKTAKQVEKALDAIDAYMRERTQALFGPIIEHLQTVGEMRGVSEIEDHFERNFGIQGVTTACEYLADQGLIGKASTTIRLTKMSNTDVQELAFFHLSQQEEEDTY